MAQVQLQLKKITQKIFLKMLYHSNGVIFTIDVQLILYCEINYKINNLINRITLKNIHNNNLGHLYKSLKSKFLETKFMQHKYYNFFKQ